MGTKNNRKKGPQNISRTGPTMKAAEAANEAKAKEAKAEEAHKRYFKKYHRQLFIFMQIFIFMLIIKTWITGTLFHQEILLIMYHYM